MPHTRPGEVSLEGARAGVLHREEVRVVRPHVTEDGLGEDGEVLGKR